MTEEDDYPIATVDLPILFGGSVTLFASGRVVITTSEDQSELSDTDVDNLADLLAQAQQIRSLR